MDIAQRWQCPFIISCIFSLFCKDIPPFSGLLVLLIVAIWCLWRKKTVFAAAIFGFCWFFLHAHWVLLWTIPSQLVQTPITIVGTITDIPVQNGNDLRFNLELVQINQQPLTWWQRPKLRLSWQAAKLQLKQGDSVKLVAKLKPPHGFSNDGGFSYQKWLLIEGIRATGYVVAGQDVVLLHQQNAVRQAVFDKVSSQTKSMEYSGLLLALTVGEKQRIPTEQWDLLKAAGISHLLAISGLHIGILFVFACFLAKVLLKLYSRVFDQHINVPRAALLFGLSAAFGYAWLAGFAVSTQRALLMLALIVITLWFKKSITAKAVVINSLFWILVIDPLAVLHSSLWLSFGAVIIILLTFWWFPTSTNNKALTYLVSVSKMQLALFLFMFPITVLLFSGFSAVSGLVNILAVPWVSLLTVPLALSGVALMIVGLPAVWLFSLANTTLSWLFVVLDVLSVADGWVSLPYFPWYSWGLVVIFCISLILPLSKPIRAMSVVLLMPALWSLGDKSSQVNLHVLDVGQGLSIVLEAQGKVLVYDLGPMYKSGFNTAEQVVLPFLRHHGYGEVDKLIISHADSDHAGDYKTFLENIPVTNLYAPQILLPGHNNCEAQNLIWQSVSIEILWPIDKNSPSKTRNDSSCVIKISYGQYSFLFTGDISRKVERQLVSRYGDKLKSTLLIAPHHGSNSSSSSLFINKVAPKYVIYSSGFLNHYKFPRAAVVERYSEAGAIQINTAETGQISFYINDDSYKIKTARQFQLAHWYLNK